MTDLTIALAAFLFLIVGIHSSESEPVMTRRKRKALVRDRLKFNPDLR